MQKPRFKPGWIFLEDPRGGILLYNEPTGRQLRIKGDSKKLYFLLSLFDGQKTIDEIASTVRQRFESEDSESIDAAIAQLTARRIVELEEQIVPGELEPEYFQRYDRHIPFFSLLDLGLNPFETQLALKQAKVAIVGLGGVGSWIVLGLLAAGIGNIRGVDMDRVEERNLGRQMLYSREHVGLPKAEAAKDFVERFCPSIKFEPVVKEIKQVNDLSDLVRGQDLVIQACDGSPRFLLRRWVNDACCSSHVPFLMVRANAIGPLCVPGVSACNTCLENKARSVFPLYDHFVEDAVRTRRGQVAAFGPMVALSSLRAALEAVKHITRIDDQIYNSMLIIDQRTGQITREKLDRDPTCPACGSLAPVFQ